MSEGKDKNTALSLTVVVVVEVEGEGGGGVASTTHCTSLRYRLRTCNVND